MLPDASQMLRRCFADASWFCSPSARQESQQQAQAAAEQLLANEKDQTGALEPWSLEQGGGHSSAVWELPSANC